MANEKEKEVKKTKRSLLKRKKVKEEVKKEEQAIEPKKKRKKTYSNKETIIVMILSIIIGALFGSAITRFICDKRHPEGLNEFDRIYNEIDNNKYSNTSRSEMLNSSINGLLSSLNDRYAYIDDSKNAMLLHEQETKGEFIGLGINVFIDDNGKINVQGVYEGSPASKVGLEAGDIIVKLDGNYYDTNNYEAFSYNILSAEKGDKVKLEVLRDNERFVKEIKLDTVVIDSVSYQLIEKDNMKVGLFKINNFADNTYDQFQKAYKEATKDGIEAIILDLRSNSEGLMKNAEKIASLFLDKGDIIYQTYNNGEYKEVVNKENKEIKLPVAVIVNSNTIATGEMLASTLNENLNAAIIGTTTFGKGYLQKVLPLYDEYAVVFSVEEWVTSNKKKVEEVGIAPTIEAVQQEENVESDTALDQALENIKSMTNYD